MNLGSAGSQTVWPLAEYPLPNSKNTQQPTGGSTNNFTDCMEHLLLSPAFLILNCASSDAPATYRASEESHLADSQQ